MTDGSRRRPFTESYYARASRGHPNAVVSTYVNTIQSCYLVRIRRDNCIMILHPWALSHTGSMGARKAISTPSASHSLEVDVSFVFQLMPIIERPNSRRLFFPFPFFSHRSF